MKETKTEAGIERQERYTEACAKGVAEGNADGRYVYSVVAGSKFDFGNIGIKGCSVYTIPYKDIAVVVHSCLAEPYDTENDDEAKGWVLEHSYVIDCATKAFGTVLPFSFDVIIKGNDEAVRDWLSQNYDHLREELERVKGRAEYSIQIFFDEGPLSEAVLSQNPELSKLKADIDSMSKGTAYLYLRKLDLKIKEEVSKEISKLAEEFGSCIGEQADEVKVERKVPRVPENYRGKKLVVALNCLVRDEKVETLGNLLDDINGRKGFAVRFTGPWAPFSFARLKEC